MTLSKIGSHRLPLLLLAGVIHLSVAAAELEGTLVPLGDEITDPRPSSSAAMGDMPAPQAPPAYEAPPAPTAPPAPDNHAPKHPSHPSEHWQRDLDKGLQQAFSNKHFNEASFNMALLIPILGVIFIFGGPVILLCYFISQHYSAKSKRQQAINLNIDKLLAAGRDIPIELLRGDEPLTAGDSSDLAKGLRNFFLGIGLLIFLTSLVGFSIGSVGFILIALGCSRMLIWYLNKPKATTTDYPQAGQQD